MAAPSEAPLCPALGRPAASMILPQKWPSYIAVRLMILFMRDLGMLCLLYWFVMFALGGVRAIAHPVSLVIEVIGAIELLFYLLFFLPYRHFLQAHKLYKPPPMDRAQRAQLFYDGLALVPHNDFEAYFRRWALVTDLDDIKRENIKDWMLWALFEVDGQKTRVGKEVDAELDQYIAEAESRMGIQIKPGRSETAKAMRLPFDSIIIQHRSLMFYFVIGLLDTVFSIFFLFSGFRFYAPRRSSFFTVFPFRFVTLASRNTSACPELGYWYRPHRSATKRPILFVHGLGMGLIPYLFWLCTISKDVGILAVEMLPVSGRITKQVLPSTPELCANITTCYRQQRQLNPRPVQGGPAPWDDIVLIANSYGTMLVGGLLREREIGPRCAATVLIDPVSLLLHLPDVAYNFTRRRPRPAMHGRPGHASEWVIWWASSTDAGTAHTLARRFCWRESVMHREALTPAARAGEQGSVADGADGTSGGSLLRAGARSTVILGGEDCVTAPSAVASYVYAGHVNWTEEDKGTWRSYQWTGTEELELLYLDGKDHGQGIMVPWPPPSINKVLEQYCRRDDFFGSMGDGSLLTSKE